MPKNIQIVPIFFDEIEIGDNINTEVYGIREVLEVNIEEKYVIISNGARIYPDNNNKLFYAHK